MIDVFSKGKFYNLIIKFVEIVIVEIVKNLVSSGIIKVDDIKILLKKKKVKDVEVFMEIEKDEIYFKKKKGMKLEVFVYFVEDNKIFFKRKKVKIEEVVFMEEV